MHSTRRVRDARQMQNAPGHATIQTMMILHYAPGNASFAVHVWLLEIGAPFELKLVDRANAAQKSPEYLRLNPNGTIPVLQDGTLVLHETAAIGLQLADTHPDALLAPPFGSVERAHYYKWMLWMSNTVQATLKHYFYPDRLVDAGNVMGAAQVKAHAQAQVGDCLAQIDAQLASHGGPWLMGDTHTALDALAFVLCRWTRGFSARPARDYPHIGPYLQRMLERPAVQRAIAAEKLPPPFV